MQSLHWIQQPRSSNIIYSYMIDGPHRPQKISSEESNPNFSGLIRWIAGKIIMVKTNLRHISLWEYRIKTLWDLCFLRIKLSKKVDILIFIPTILDLSNNLAKPEVAPSGGLFVKQDRKRFELERPSFVLALADCNLTRLPLIATPAAFLHSCFLHHLLFILDVTQLLDMLCRQKAETTYIKTRPRPKKSIEWIFERIYHLSSVTTI